jgi:Uma2 family endonuclease
MVTGQRLSVEEYLALPEEKPYLEYLCGEARPKMAPDMAHWRIAGWLVRALGEYQSEHGGQAGVEGRAEFEDAGAVRFLLPDVSYYAPGRAIDAARAMAPPTLAVEIRSPDESILSQREKCHFYVSHGVDVAWLVDPQNHAVEVFERGEHRVLEAGEKLTSVALPGLRLLLDELFELPGP